MNQNDLTAIEPELSALQPEEITSPDLPMATALQEAHDLLTLLGQADVRAKLFAVGLGEDAPNRLSTLLSAARAAQSRWVVIRDRQKSEAQQQREEQGQELRREVLAACRWSLRDDRVAMGTLGAIAEGEGVADLIQDLNDLATLIDSRVDAFAADQTFDAAAKAEEARSLASELQAGTSLDRLDTNQNDARDLRDRAYSLLLAHVADIREAGRYAFRNDETMRERFGSAYLRRRRRRRAGAGVTVDDGADSVI